MKGLTTGERKAEIRKLIRQRRDTLPKSQKESLSSIIAEKVVSSVFYKSALVIMFYANHLSEVETLGLIKNALKSGKRVCLPKVDRKVRGNMKAVEIKSATEDIEPGSYGIFEPKKDCGKIVRENEVDLVFVPAVVFDEEGHRIGYGKGYYDRWLGKMKDKIKVGLAYDFQVLKEIPKTRTDVPVDLIITEKRVIRVKRKE